jgi:hypothetical protein
MMELPLLFANLPTNRYFRELFPKGVRSDR